MAAKYLVVPQDEIWQIFALWRQFAYAYEIQATIADDFVSRSNAISDQAKQSKGKQCAVIPLAAIKKLATLNRSEFAVILFLAQRYIKSRNHARMKTKELVKLSGISRQNLELAIKSLIRKGLITKIKQHPNYTIANGSTYKLGI